MTFIFTAEYDAQLRACVEANRVRRAIHRRKVEEAQRRLSQPIQEAAERWRERMAGHRLRKYG